MAFDVEARRADFPALDQEIHGRPLVYLDSAASALVPRAVIEAVSGYYASNGSNVHRGVHELSQRATEELEGARRELAAFLGAGSAREVVFTAGATAALNLVAQGWARPRLEPGDEILISALEHHSNLVPWQMVARATGARLVQIPILASGELDLEACERLLGPRTRVVALAHVSNALGTVLPVTQMAERARAVGALVVVDGSQAAPHLELDLPALGVDFYAVAGHKLYGPSGIGLLWGRSERLAETEPWQGGGEMIRRVRFDSSDYAEPPARFEAGTPNVAGALGLAAAARYLAALDRPALEVHEAGLRALARELLGEVDGLHLLGPERGVAVQSFTVEGAGSHDVGALLDQGGIAVRTGQHCAEPLLAALGIEDSVRASTGLYTTRGEIEALAAAVREAAAVFGAN